MFLLIGSRAAKYHFSDFRSTHDFDFICERSDYEYFKKNYTVIHVEDKDYKCVTNCIVDDKKYQVEFYHSVDIFMRIAVTCINKIFF